MTLTRQLLFSGFLVLIALFSGMCLFTLKHTQSFLNQQLSSHAQDTATALGLSLSQSLKGRDIPTSSRIVDAIFDRGYYQSITVENAKGVPIIALEMDVVVKQVPKWFVSILPLNTQRQEALVMSKWQRVGKVYVESNPGFAYQQIYNTFSHSIFWLVFISSGGLILGLAILWMILKPLRAITHQANAICNQEFAIVSPLPKTKDLAKVVQAMNKMSHRLKAIFEEHARNSEQLREQAYRCPITHLGNRRYFEMQFEYLLHGAHQRIGGILILLALKDFKAYNEKWGFEAGDKLLAHTAQLLKDSCQTIDNCILAHMGGANFAAVLPNKPQELGEQVAKGICQGLSQYTSLGLVEQSDVGHLGLTRFLPGGEKSKVLASADMALRNAQTKGPNQWHFFVDVEHRPIHSATQWKQIFEKAIHQTQFLLHFQPIEAFSYSASMPQQETLLRLKNEQGELINAGVFMPMAERLHKMEALDKMVVESVKDRLLNDASKIQYTINLSPSSIHEQAFREWLLETCRKLGQKRHQLVFELPEYGIHTRLSEVAELFQHLHQLGCQTSIDHFGRNFSSFGYLKGLKLNYLKIDGSFVRRLPEKEENQFFIRSLVKIAHSLEIIVFAESVETQKELEILKSLGIDGAQGFLIGKPTEK